MIKTVGVIAIKLETASKFLHDLIGEMPYKNIKNIIDRQNNCYAELVDGTIYKTVPSNDSARGHRFTDLYLQHGLDQEFINYIAMPFLIAHDDGSEPTVTYFD
jgi:hypothetical protein